MRRASFAFLTFAACLFASPALAQPERAPNPPPQPRVIVTPPPTPTSPPSAAAPAQLARTWAVQNMRSVQNGVRGVHASACVVITNFGGADARIGIDIVNQDGVAMWSTPEQDLRILRGGTLRRCFADDNSREEVTLLVTSTTPVAVMGYATVSQPDATGDAIATNLTIHHPGAAYPVDCAQPAGFEFVCDTIRRRVIVR